MELRTIPVAVMSLRPARPRSSLGRRASVPRTKSWGASRNASRCLRYIKHIKHRHLFHRKEWQLILEEHKHFENLTSLYAIIMDKFREKMTVNDLKSKQNIYLLKQNQNKIYIY